MRIYISIDMEGVSMLERVHEITPGKAAHDLFCAVMAGDANAVVDGAIAGGATDVLVVDGHARMTNIDPTDLDPRARLKSGAGRLIQLKGLSADFDAAMFVGYHSRSGTAGILSHTFVSSFLDVRIDGTSLGEAGVNNLVLRSMGVPIILLSGDDLAIGEARAHLGEIEYVQTKRALSRTSAEHIPLDLSRKNLRDAAQRAVATVGAKRDSAEPHVAEDVTVEIDLAVSPDNSFPPDAHQRNARFVDSPASEEISDFEFAQRSGLTATEDGTVAIVGPISDTYQALGGLAGQLMERNLEYLYRSAARDPYTRSITDLVGEAPLNYLGSRQTGAPNRPRET